MKRRGVVAVLMVAGLCGLSCVTQAATPLVVARQKFFGVENVDPNTGAVKKDRVVFSWLTNTTFLAAVQGRVIMMDSYVTRLEISPGRTPFVIQEMVDVKPEAILIGHGHFDHADNAAYIAKLTGATIYASEETCAAMQADIVRMFNDPNAINGGAKIVPDANPIPCTNVVTAGSTPGAEITHLTFLEPIACVIAFKHMHSNAVPPDPAYPAFPFNVSQDSRDAQMYPRGTTLTPPTNPASRVPGQINTTTTGSGGVGGPIAIFYEVILRSGYNFSFAWHNSTGPLKEGIAPDGAWGPAIGQNLFNLFAALPPADIEFGSASSANTANNGHRDLVQYQQYLRPQIFYPGHMTTGTNGVGESSSQELYYMYRGAQANIATVQSVYKPEVRWLVDPIDYLRPILYNVGDTRWSNPDKAARIKQFCG